MNKEPKIWEDMTDAEKGALLLAHHRGKTIQTWLPYKKMWDAPIRLWGWDCAYRVKPEPKRETVAMYSAARYKWNFEELPAKKITHTITFDLIDGEPDCASIRMEKL